MVSFASVSPARPDPLLGFANNDPVKRDAVGSIVVCGSTYQSAARRASVQPSTVHQWMREFRLECDKFNRLRLKQLVVLSGHD